MYTDRFDRLLDRMQESGVAKLDQLIGCSAEEVSALEARYGLRLPHTYRLYLLLMGRRSGRLFTHDHMAVYYQDVFDLTAYSRNGWAESNAEDGSGPPPEFKLPEDALMVASRLSDQFLFIRCNDETDSPLWYFNTWDWKFQESYPSVLSWLESWCDEAAEVIAKGTYYAMFPNGTTP